MTDQLKQKARKEIYEVLNDVYYQGAEAGEEAGEVWTADEDIERVMETIDSLIDEAREKGPELSRVTRLEVIDYTRDIEEVGALAYGKWDSEIKVEQELQDDNRTLKIFISKK